jgi:hypothetical protein
MKAFLDAGWDQEELETVLADICEIDVIPRL